MIFIAVLLPFVISGYNPTDKLLENLTIVIDADGNGQIEFNEFIDLIDKLETAEKADKEGKLLKATFSRIKFNKHSFFWHTMVIVTKNGSADSGSGQKGSIK